MQIAARIDVPLTALTPARAVAYLKGRAAEVGQKTLDMERQAIQAMMVNVTGQLPPGATLPVVKSTEPHRPRPRAYSPVQVRAVAARQDVRNALATEIVHASGIRAHELLALGRPEEQPPDDRRDRSHLTGTAAEGMKFAGRDGVVYTVAGKGGLVREVLLPRGLSERLEARRLDVPQRVVDRGERSEQDNRSRRCENDWQHRTPIPVMARTRLISLIEIARIHNKRKQAVFRIVRKLGLSVEKAVGQSTRGQRASHIAIQDYQTNKQHFIAASPGAARSQPPPDAVTQAVFYLISTEPELDPGRFKVGFSNDVDERMHSHKTSAPLAKLVSTWPCKQLWEKTAIDCVAAGCERLDPEVFRARDIREAIERADRFFELMPRLPDD